MARRGVSVQTPSPRVPRRGRQRRTTNAFGRLSLAHIDVTQEKTRALARQLRNDFDTFWVTLDHPEWPLTKNVAEQALRHWVIAWRISQGTRTAQGSRTIAVLASVIDTCRKRGVSPWDFITEVVTERRRGQPAPRLPATA